MDYRKKLQAAAALERQKAGSVLARTVAKGAALDALTQSATLLGFSDAVAEAGVGDLVPVECWAWFATVYGAADLTPAEACWEWARCAA